MLHHIIYILLMVFVIPFRPFIEGKDTVMRSSIDVIKQVAVTLYYLSDEGRIRKTANAFGISRQAVSKIVRKVRQLKICIRTNKFLMVVIKYWLSHY